MRHSRNKDKTSHELCRAIVTLATPSSSFDELHNAIWVLLEWENELDDAHKDVVEQALRLGPNRDNIMVYSDQLTDEDEQVAIHERIARIRKRCGGLGKKRGKRRSRTLDAMGTASERLAKPGHDRLALAGR